MSLAFVFPGQGSQSLGMMSSLADEFQSIQSTFVEASEVLDYDLWNLVVNGPEDELNITSKTQPTLLTAGVAVWRIWHEKGGTSPCLMAGHSLGEYTALVCAGALSFKEAVKLVEDRGIYMQSAVPEGTGAMAAILGLEDDVVKTICEQSGQGQTVAAANYNSPGQIVISGHSKAVARAVDAAKKAGAKRSVVLSVSVPSHCELMQEAAKNLATRLETVKIMKPQIPVVQNVNLQQTSDAEKIRQALIEQLSRPVRWTDSIQKMIDDGITHIVESGPGRILSGLIKRIDREITMLPTITPELFNKALSKVTN